jgi:hypothetical protein
LEEGEGLVPLVERFSLLDRRVRADRVEDCPAANRVALAERLGERGTEVQDLVDSRQQSFGSGVRAGQAADAASPDDRADQAGAVRTSRRPPGRPSAPNSRSSRPRSPVDEVL